MKNKIINLFGKKIVPNTGVKYSELLEQFMTPFSDEFGEMESIDDIFYFAVNAWNFGNLKLMIPPEDFDKMRKDLQKTNFDFTLLNRMIDYKAEQFKEYDSFMIDFELKEVQVGEDPILSVITQEKEDYLIDLLQAMEAEPSKEDFEENYINRSAVILKPKQPFIDWYIALNPDEDEELFRKEMNEPSIYLVKEYDDDLEKLLKKKFDKFFTMELGDWHTNKKEWPQKRNYKMFKLWFQVETSMFIYDLEKTPVQKTE